jgi:hypothetical protein
VSDTTIDYVEGRMRVDDYISIRLCMDRDKVLSDDEIEQYAATAARQARTYLGGDEDAVAFDVNVPVDPNELDGQRVDAEYVDRVAEAAAQQTRTRLTDWRTVQRAGSRA